VSRNRQKPTFARWNVRIIAPKWNDAFGLTWLAEQRAEEETKFSSLLNFKFTGRLRSKLQPELDGIPLEIFRNSMVGSLKSFERATYLPTSDDAHQVMVAFNGSLDYK